jgi:hypothetical protein
MIGASPRLAMTAGMPTVSAFFGIVIYIYFDDHSPPHFHAEYAGNEAVIGIDSLVVLRGRLPRRAMALVLEWAQLHRAELAADWERARRLEPLVPIAPLE